MTQAPAFEFRRQGRSTRTALALALAWALILLAGWRLDAALWVLALPALATLPAAWDLWQNPAAGLVLTDEALGWYSGRREVRLDLDEIKCVRLDRRLDMSLRLSVVLTSGKRLRIPAESAPPAEALEPALAARDIAVERHPFSLF